MARAKSFFPGGLKFSSASVKNNHDYEKKYFECVFGCKVCNITGRATTPDKTVHCNAVITRVTGAIKSNRVISDTAL